MEIWRDIQGYEGIYQVSNYGRVRSLKFGKDIILKSSNDGKGYLIVGLCKDGKVKMHRIHRLVAEAFIKNPTNLPQVNHKDECKTNNFVENLEWCDALYNSNFGTRNERLGKNVAKKLSKLVYQYTLEGELVAIYESASEAASQLGFNQGNISQCCLGKRKTHKDYKWSYNEL